MYSTPLQFLSFFQRTYFIFISILFFEHVDPNFSPLSGLLPLSPPLLFSIAFKLLNKHDEIPLSSTFHSKNSSWTWTSTWKIPRAPFPRTPDSSFLIRRYATSNKFSISRPFILRNELERVVESSFDIALNIFEPFKNNVREMKKFLIPSRSNQRSNK